MCCAVFCVDAVRFGKSLGIEGAFLYKFSAKVAELRARTTLN